MITSDATALIRSARTMLFVPGDRDWFAKAAGCGADLVVCDLEDAVASSAKSTARKAVRNWLDSGGSALVRVNAATTSDYDLDIEVLSGADGLLGVMVAKAETTEALRRVHEKLRVPVVALIETARGVADVRGLAKTRGVGRLAFGALDYAADLACSPEREAMYSARSELVLASRLGGLAGPIDGITTDLVDSSVVTDDVTYARSLGFSGKLVVHPSQVSPAHAAFAPTPSEVAWAHRIVEAADAGVVKIEGQMVDAPVVARAVTILQHEVPNDDAIGE